MSKPIISVIIPASGETVLLARLLGLLSGQRDTEVIVSIPRGDIKSLQTASGYNVKTVEGKPGRGVQLDRGAEEAAGEILLFCHADTTLPDGWKEAVTGTMRKPGVSGGAFRLAIDSGLLRHRIIASSANLRSALLGLIYGDQAVFTSREFYKKSGGFRPMPIMEDVDFIKRLRRMGKVSIVKKAVLTSPRRWLSEGALYCVLRNSILVSLYLLGVEPGKLSRWYSGTL
ncbi:MAG: glycosyl transferase family 2 [bacterium]|nr:MAG: glycosyl transferase family 2 [bacterium]